MNLVEIEQAKSDAVRAKRRFEQTLAAVQDRLRPGNLAEEAWDGVKDKGADLADGALQAVKSRPKAVSLALGALAIFLARQPLKRAVTRLISGDEEGDGNNRDDAELSVTEGVN
ncbi:MAG TPA: hypothetical protein VK614_13370 [Allosphingosinicella sp.]|nr:hypothetical protein [Allosphingosinicella sp.]